MSRLLRAAWKFVLRLLAANQDLVLVWWASVVLHPLVPVGNAIARDDLIPWTALTLTACTLLRRAPIGEGPHPMLPAAHTAWEARFRAMAIAASPLALAALYVAGADRSPAALGVALAIGAGMLFFLWLGKKELRTPWNPPGVGNALLWTALSSAAILGALFAGAWQRTLGDLPMFGSMGRSAWVGLAFTTVALLAGRTRHLRQRIAAGRRDGRRWWPDLFHPAMLLLGPSAGFWLICELHALLGVPVDFRTAFVGALHVAAWAAIAGTRKDPVAVQCFLHEVVPVGGSDTPSGAPFDRPPEGALRISPLDLRRTRSVHPYFVPVQRPRIEGVDDPVRPLWARPSAPLSAHILGSASFEIDPDTRDVQVDTLTIRLRSLTEVSALSDGLAQTRRIAVLRAWPAIDESWRARIATYRWERGVPEASHQLVDASTDKLTLRDGSVVVLSAEGVIRAFELEIGAVVDTLPDGGIVRLPQIEDYEAIG